ncbi:MAG: ribosome silencing factor [Anaerovoracaceae bacterium]
MNNKDFALLAARVMDGKKAQDIVVIDIQEKSSFADYLVIASGGSERQVLTLADEVEEQLAKEGLLVRNIEGKNGSGWILMDFGDVIVNVFTKEVREKYNIEKVWGDCSFLDLEDEQEK